MDRDSWHCIGDRDQEHPHRKEMQKSKMAIWGGLTNSCEKKRSKKQRRKEKICPSECRVPKDSKKRSLVFSILFFSSISLHWSLKAFLSLLAILWNSAFRCLHLSFSPLLFTSFLFTAICKASPDSLFVFLHFFPWGWSWSLSPVQYHEPPSIVHQALYLSDLVP